MNSARPRPRRPTCSTRSSSTGFRREHYRREKKICRMAMFRIIYIYYVASAATGVIIAGATEAIKAAATAAAATAIGVGVKGITITHKVNLKIVMYPPSLDYHQREICILERVLPRLPRLLPHPEPTAADCCGSPAGDGGGSCSSASPPTWRRRRRKKGSSGSVWRWRRGRSACGRVQEEKELP